MTDQELFELAFRILSEAEALEKLQEIRGSVPSISLRIHKQNAEDLVDVLNKRMWDRLHENKP